MAAAQTRRSPEIEAVLVRSLESIAGQDIAAMERLISPDPWLRAIGTDPDEWWDQTTFLPVMKSQIAELGNATVDVFHVEGWQRGDVAWGASRLRYSTAVGSVEIRVTAVYTLDAGVWRIVQWHASEGVPNEESFGISLTTTLTEMLDSLDLERDFAAVAEGMLTLMFTDVADSTTHAQELGDRVYAELMAAHVRLVSELTEVNGGQVVKTVGDGALVVFPSARGAVDAAVGIQRETARRNMPYAVRIGLHAGDVVRTDSDVMGLAVNKAARVTSAAAGGQIVVSSVVRELVGAHEARRFGVGFAAELKGIPGIHELVPVEWRDGVSTHVSGWSTTHP